MNISQPLLIACDFDGTVTLQDTLVEILNTYGSPQWHDIQKKVAGGELSIREGLQREMESVQATEEDIQQLLMKRIAIDPTFPPFLQRMKNKGIPVIILTGGFDLCVELVLLKAGVWPLPFLANRIRRQNGLWKVEYPYLSATCSDCGHCKGDPIRTWNQQGYTTIFIGNGVTDRCAAEHATLTFAKDELKEWCAKNRVAAASFQSFADVDADLQKKGWL